MSRTQVHTVVVEHLGRQIAQGVVLAGSVLLLEDIQDAYQVSRTVAREVMRVLQSMGLVRARQRVGITVQPVSEWHVLDTRLLRWRLAGPDREQLLRELTELRATLEPQAGAMAATRATPQQRARLEQLVQVMEDAERSGQHNSPEARAAFVEFDVLLLEASGNGLVAALGLLPASIGEVVDLSALEPDWVQSRRAIVDAIAAGDAAGAADAIRERARELLSFLKPGATLTQA